jgi:hypothetical protein
MPIQIDVLEEKVFSQFKNGETFSSNLTDFTPNLVGSVMEKLKLVVNYKISWGTLYIAPNGDSTKFEWLVQLIGTELTISRNDGESFIKDGFYKGQNTKIILNYTTGSSSVKDDKTVTFVSDDTIRFESITSIPATIISVAITGKEPLTALIHNFGLIENDESFNSISKVTDNNQGYYTGGVGVDSGGGRSTSFVNMIGLGQYNDFITGNCKVRYVQNSIGIFGIADAAQEFQLEHEFIINAWYVDGGLNDLINGVAPDYLQGTASLKYAYESDFREALSNPNTRIIAVSDKSLGSVAWFNENFNGFDNLYNIESVTYSDSATSNSSSALQITAKTNVEIVISKIGGSFTNGDKLGAYISYLPTANEYTNTITDMVHNFMYDNIFCIVGSSQQAGSGIFKTAEAELDGSNVKLTVEVDYDTAQKLRLFNVDEPNYIIGVQCGDITIDSGDIDKVILKIVDGYVVGADIPDLIINEDLKIYPYDQRIGIDSGYTDLISWNEDGFTAKLGFGLDLSKQSFLNSLEVSLVAHNNLINDFFILDNFVFPVANGVISNGIQQFNISDTRSYELQPLSQYNIVSLNTGSKIGDIQGYELFIGQKITWQEWIKNNDVNTVFYDPAKLNDNLNNKASNYDRLNGYNIKLAIRYNVTGVNDLGIQGITDYVTLSPNLQTWDYNKYTLVGATPEWNGFPTLTRESNGANIPSPLSGELTKMQVRWSSTQGSIGNIAEYYICHRIEVFRQNGSEIYEIDTIYERPNENPLIPLSGESYLKTYIDGGFVYSECLIDGNFIESGESYSLSATLKREGGGVPADAKITEEGETKITETGEIKIVE